MSQFTTLTLKDYALADIDFTVGTINTQTGVATWNGPFGAVSSYENRPQITFLLTLPSAKSSRARCKLKISVPVIEPVTNKRIDEDIFTCEFALSKVGSYSNREDLWAFAKSLMAHQTVENAVLGFEGVY